MTSMPLRWGAHHCGNVVPTVASALRAFPSIFEIRSESVRLCGDTAADIERALEEVCLKWRAANLITDSTDELLDARDFQTEQPLFAISRAARPYFGTLTAGAHLNGHIMRNDVPHLWIAQRAATKRIAPLKWDEIADGAVASGETAHQAMQREAWEESGIPASLSSQAREVAQFRFTHRQGDLSFYELAFHFDLELPDTFMPDNRDGEVAQFALVSPSELRLRLSAGDFADDIAAAARAWLQRHHVRLIPSRR